MNETSEREQDAAVIAKSAQRHADLRALATLSCVHIEETALLIRVANAGADLIQAQHRERGRLTAERDAAHEKIVSFGSTMADLIMLRSENTRLEAETIESAAILEKAVKESKAIVAGYNKAIAERDATRADADKLFALLNTLESAMDLAHFELTNDFRIERLPVAVVFLRKGLEFARAALGIESEASE